MKREATPRSNRLGRNLLVTLRSQRFCFRTLSRLELRHSFLEVWSRTSSLTMSIYRFIGYGPSLHFRMT